MKDVLLGVSFVLIYTGCISSLEDTSDQKLSSEEMNKSSATDLGFSNTTRSSSGRVSSSHVIQSSSSELTIPKIQFGVEGGGEESCTKDEYRTKWDYLLYNRW